jgi:hypothetical protein
MANPDNHLRKISRIVYLGIFKSKFKLRKSWTPELKWDLNY